MKNIPQAYRPSYLWFWPPLILGGSVISAGTVHDLRRVKVLGTGPLWNPCISGTGWTKFNQIWVGPFQNYVWQPCLPFKMAAVTKNRNFFNCPLLLYYKSKWDQILMQLHCSEYIVVLHIIRVFLWNFSFSRFIQIMQIGHILIKDHI